jgi:hypothetical protein
VRYADLLGEGTADEDGFAWAAFGGWEGDRHWAASAPGYAATSEIGYRPPATMALRPGIEVSGRILDPIGRPAAGVDIEVRAAKGCPHVPSLARTRTDGDGRFTLRDASPDWNLWLVPSGPGAAEDVGVADFYRLGTAYPEHVLGTGWTALGRVVDPSGDPIAGVVVRSTEYPRGPVAVTGEDGSFRLPGVRPHSPLFFVHPRAAHAQSKEWPGSDPCVLDAWADGVRLTVPMALGRFAWPEDAREVRLRVVAPSVEAPEASVRWTRRDDGRSWLVRTEADPGRPGESSAEHSLPPGAYDVTAGWPFDAVAVRATAVEVREEEGQSFDFPADPQPRLVLEGEGADTAFVTLVVPGAQASRPAGDDGAPASPDWGIHLPASGDAVVQQEVLGRLAFLPVGPQSGGVRRAALLPARPHRLRVPGRPWLESASGTWIGGSELPEGGGVETRAAGSVVLVTSTEDVDVRIPVELPSDRPADRTIDPGPWRERSGGSATLDVSASGARPERVSTAVLAAGDARGEILGKGLLDGDEVGSRPALVRVVADGFQPIDVAVSGPGEHRAAWGSCSLALEALDDDGGWTEARFAVDGHVHEGSMGEATVLGLSPGRHRVLVQPASTALVAKEVVLRLRDGEARTLRVRLESFD